MGGREIAMERGKGRGLAVAAFPTARIFKQDSNLHRSKRAVKWELDVAECRQPLGPTVCGD